MIGIQNEEIFRLLKIAIKDSGFTQADIAKRMNITPPCLSRQLNRRDPLSVERAFEILKFITIRSEARKKIADLITQEMDLMDNREKGEEIMQSMIRKVRSIGHDSLLSFILDFWVDMNQSERMDIFKLFVDYVDKCQKEKQKVRDALEMKI